MVIIIPAVIVYLWQFLEQNFFSPLPIEAVAAQQVLASLLFLLVLWSQVRAKNEPTLSEEKLARSEQKFKHLYDNSPIPYVTTDRRGIIATANLAAVRLFDSTKDSLAGHDFLDSLQAEDNSLSVFRGKLKNGSVINRKEMMLKTLTGQERWVLLSVFVYGVRNERLVTMVDVTQQKAIDQAKSEFVALASHQLRTPIAAVRWNVELLQMKLKDSLGEKSAEYLTKIENNVSRMNNLINDFLSVSKLEIGTFATDKIEIKLDDFLDSVLEEHDPTIVSKQIKVLRTYDPEDFTIKTDERLLHIIANNLISNAVKYTNDSGAVEVSYISVGREVELTVTDDGIGIPIGEQERLFSKFYRATNAQGHKAEGTGLGLYIVKEAVEKLGGRISVASEENVGTKFTVNLPVK